MKFEFPLKISGITMPNVPNAFVCHGPNTGLGHNSVIFMLECQNNYRWETFQKKPVFSMNCSYYIKACFLHIVILIFENVDYRIMG